MHVDVEKAQRGISDEESRLAEARAAKIWPPLDSHYIAEVSSAWAAGILHFLLGNLVDARVHLNSVGERAVTALFGDWRVHQEEWSAATQQFEPFGSEVAARAKSAWIPAVRYGLAASGAVGDVESARKIASYMVGPRLNDIGYTAGPWNTPEAVDLYEAYADLLLERPLRLPADWPSPPRRSSKRCMLLKECITAISGRDRTGALNSLDEYITYYARHERDSQINEDLISVDATILSFLVRRLVPAAQGEPEHRPFVLQFTWGE